MKQKEEMQLFTWEDEGSSGAKEAEERSSFVAAEIRHDWSLKLRRCRLDLKWTELKISWISLSLCLVREKNEGVEGNKYIKVYKMSAF